MAVSTSIAALHHAKIVKQPELDAITVSFRKTVVSGDRGPNCLALLRQIYNIVNFNRRPDVELSPSLVNTIYGMLIEPEQGPPGIRIMCLSILLALVPSSLVRISGFKPPVDRQQIPHLLPLLIGDNLHFSDMDSLLPEVITWIISSAGVREANLRLAAQSFIAAVAQSKPELMRPLRVSEFNASLIGMLKNTSTVSTPSPNQKQGGLFQGKAKQQFITELDGSKIRDFYTVLNVSPTKWHSVDQIMSAHAFSMVNCWLENAYCSQGIATGPNIDELTETVKEGIIEYVVRIIHQGTSKIPEDKSLSSGDRKLIQSSLIEAVQAVDKLCTIDPVLVPRLLPEIKRLLTSRAQSDALLQLTVIRFFTNHGEQVVYDLQPSYTAFFGDTLALQYRDPSVAAETVSFCIEYYESLSSVFIKFFPNILKILAWAPRTYLGEFVELFPQLVSQETYIELFHAIVDLPCLAAALQETKPGDTQFSHISSGSSNPTITNALMNYILRKEGGLGGTIDRLGELHGLLSKFTTSKRVQVAADISPLLLQSYFSSIVQHASKDEIQHVVSIMLERMLKLYAVGEDFTAEIGKVMARYCLLMFEKSPQIIVDLRKELVEFVSDRTNVVAGKEGFFIHVVWAIGEYASSSLDPRCTPEMIDQFYEALELFAYEVHGELQNDPSATKYKDIHTTRLMTVLISALGKLGARVQDLIPRVLLCLTKIMKQQHNNKNPVKTLHQRQILERASQVVGTLQRPPIAATVLNQPWTPSGKLCNRHSNPTMSLALLRFASSIGESQHETTGSR